VSGEHRQRILLVGVGGQGVVTGAEILGLAAREASLDVNVGQLHGMAQRGGSVESTVVLGAGRTAFVGAGEADVLVAFEPLEALRALPRLHQRSLVLVNTGTIPPFALAQSAETYPEVAGIVAQIREVVPAVHLIDGPAITTEAGDVLSLNMAMLGALTGLHATRVGQADMEAAITGRYPPHSHAMNLRAFHLGIAAMAGEGAGTR